MRLLMDSELHSCAAATAGLTVLCLSVTGRKIPASSDSKTPTGGSQHRLMAELPYTAQVCGAAWRQGRAG